MPFSSCSFFSLKRPLKTESSTTKTLSSILRKIDRNFTNFWETLYRQQFLFAVSLKFRLTEPFGVIFFVEVEKTETNLPQSGQQKCCCVTLSSSEVLKTCNAIKETASVQCGTIELWMHLGDFLSTQEARVTLGYRLVRLLRFLHA